MIRNSITIENELITTSILLILNIIIYFVLTKVLLSNVFAMNIYFMALFTIVILIGYVSSFVSSLYVVISEVIALVLIILGTAYSLGNIDESFLSQLVVTIAVTYVLVLIIAKKRKSEGTNYGEHRITLPLKEISSSWLSKNVLIDVIGILGIFLVISYVISLLLPHRLLTITIGFMISYGFIIDIRYLVIIIAVSLLSLIVFIVRSSLINYPDMRTDLMVKILWSALFTLIPLSLPTLLSISSIVTKQSVKHLTISHGRLVRMPSIPSQQLPQDTNCEVLIGKIIDALPRHKGTVSIGSNLCYNAEIGLNNHVLILGATGTGKTRLAKSLIKQAIRQGYKVIVIDTHGEYRDIQALKVDPRINKVNILDTLNSDPNEVAEEVSDLIAETFKLGNVQRDTLRRLIEITFSMNERPNLDNLISLINEISLMNHEELRKIYGDIDVEVVKSLIPYLSSLRRISSKGQEWINIESLMKNNVVIDLSSINNKFLMRTYAETIVRTIFNYVKSNQVSKESRLIVVEEAHNFISKGREGILGKILREGRKFGINIIAITQSPSDLGETLIANFKWVIMFPALSTSQYISLMKSALSLDQEDLARIRDLTSTAREGEAFVLKQGEGRIYYIKTYISE